MAKYAGDRNFERIDTKFSLKMSFEDMMSFSDFAETLKDLDRIFDACVNECFPRLKGSNSKRHSGLLAIEDFKTGSLELVIIPFCTGVVSGVAANAIFAVFLHTLRRVKGKPKDESKLDPPPVDPAAISPDNLKIAGGKAVEKTQKQRKNLDKRMKTFGLSISISYNGSSENL